MVGMARAAAFKPRHIENSSRSLGLVSLEQQIPEGTSLRLPPPATRHLDAVQEKKILTITAGTTWAKRRHEEEDAEAIVQHVEESPADTSHVSSAARKLSVESNCNPSASNEKFKPKFTVDTVADGFNGGRTYCIRCNSVAECQEWVSEVNRVSSAAKEQKKLQENRGTPLFEKIILQSGRIHRSHVYEGLIAVVITATFICSLIEAQLNPEPGTEAQHTLEVLDTVFTGIFVVEIVINMLANWFFPFWCGEGWAWNLFDLLVVAVSLVTMNIDENSRFTSLRLIRAFRVVRLFRRFRSLRKIVNALTAAVVPVTNAFIVLGVVSSIYGIIGVQLFRLEDRPNFGTFTQALYTMFQVLTGDSWSSGIARPLFGDDEQPRVSVALFFVSYIVINGIFVLNVVVAILLDEFIGAVDRDKRKEKDEQQNDILKATMHRGTAIDPLLHALSSFSSMDDLSEKIQAVYSILDANDSGGLNMEELSHGLRRLRVTPPIHFTEEDFEVLTDGRRLCNAEGEIDSEAFEVMMREQLKQFMKRHIGARMNFVCQSDVQTETVLFMLKTLMFTNDTSRASSAFSRTASADPSTGNLKQTPGPGRGASGPQPDSESVSRVEEDVAELKVQMSALHSKLDAIAAALTPSPAPALPPRTLLGWPDSGSNRPAETAPSESTPSRLQASRMLGLGPVTRRAATSGTADAAEPAEGRHPSDAPTLLRAGTNVSSSALLNSQQEPVMPPAGALQKPHQAPEPQLSALGRTVDETVGPGTEDGGGGVRVPAASVHGRGECELVFSPPTLRWGPGQTGQRAAGKDMSTNRDTQSRVEVGASGGAAEAQVEGEWAEAEAGGGGVWVDNLGAGCSVPEVRRGIAAVSVAERTPRKSAAMPGVQAR